MCVIKIYQLNAEKSRYETIESSTYLISCALDLHIYVLLKSNIENET